MEEYDAGLSGKQGFTLQLTVAFFSENERRQTYSPKLTPQLFHPFHASVHDGIVN